MKIIRIFGISTRKRTLRTGYLSCPTCCERTRGELSLKERIFYFLGFVPLGSVGESRNFLTCHSCGESFEESGDWAYDFGDHREPKQWDCRRCGEQNPGDQFRCRRCRRHV
jgi:hypothetical protein